MNIYVNSRLTTIADCVCLSVDDSEHLVYQGERVTWYRPQTLAHLLDLKSQFPDARLVIGNTEIGTVDETSVYI